MNKVKIWKFIAVLLSFIPLALISPAWLGQVEGLDIAILAASAAMLVFLIWRRWKEALSSDKFGLLLAVPSAAVMLLAWRNVYFCDARELFIAAGAVLFGFGMVWTLFGWRLFYRLFPVPLMILTGFPMPLARNIFPGITPHWKIAIACALCIYALFALLTDFNPIRRRTAFFAAAVVVYALLYAAL